jgi:glycosyltransferase involved in cell wall biosynthesis
VKIGRQIADSIAGLPMLAGPVRSLQLALRSGRSHRRTLWGGGRQAVVPRDWLPSDPGLLHVIAVSHEATRSGAPQALLRLVRHVRSQSGCTARIVFRTKGGLEGDFRAAAPTIALPGAVGDCDALAAQLARSGTRCVVVCNTIATADMALACRARGIPVVSWIHEMPTVIEQFFGGRSTVRAMADASAAVVLPTEALRREIVDRYQLDAGKTHAVNYGVDPPRSFAERQRSREDVRRELGITAANKIVLGVGRAELRKGVDIFVQVAARILRDRQRRGVPVDSLPYFVWVGAEDESCCRWTHHDVQQFHFHLADHIRFLGEKPDARRYLEAADVFLMPSREDPCPLVAFEAAANGLPVVHFSGPVGSDEVLLAAESALVPYLDVDGMVDRVDGLLEGDSVAPAGEPIDQRLPWSACTGRMLELVQAAAGSQGRRSVARPSGKRVLVISYGPPPVPGVAAVEGGGLRCWGLARGLVTADPTLAVTLAIPDWHDVPLPPTHEGVRLVRWSREAIAGLVADYDVVIASYCLGDDSVRIADAVRPPQMLVLDAYVPIHVEMCARRSANRDREFTDFERERRNWETVLRRGDVFLCASEQQRLYYLGVLATIGRINPLTYDEDPVRIVPYGVHPEEPQPRRLPCTELVGRPDAWKLLWFGGVYPWFDIEGLLEAVKILDEIHPTRLVVVGSRNPFVRNDDFDRHHERFLQLVGRPDVAPLVHLVDWVQFHDRGDWYLDADMTILANQPGIENAVAWRTRVVDYLWARVPVATNGGDPIGDELIAAGAAVRIDVADPRSTAAAIAGVLKDPAARAAMQQQCGALREKYLWPTVVEPLLEAITHREPAAMASPATVADLTAA